MMPNQATIPAKALSEALSLISETAVSPYATDWTRTNDRWIRNPGSVEAVRSETLDLQSDSSEAGIAENVKTVPNDAGLGGNALSDALHASRDPGWLSSKTNLDAVACANCGNPFTPPKRSDGRIASCCSRKCAARYGWNKNLSHLLKPAIFHAGRRYAIDKDGYYRCTDWGRRTSLHRDLWIEANGEIPDSYDVHHKNECKTDNRLENLEPKFKPDHMRDHHAKPVRRLDTGEVFPSATAVAHLFDIAPTRMCVIVSKGTEFDGTRWEYLPSLHPAEAMQ